MITILEAVAPVLAVLACALVALLVCRAATFGTRSVALWLLRARLRFVLGELRAAKDDIRYGSWDEQVNAFDRLDWLERKAADLEARIRVLS